MADPATRLPRSRLCTTIATPAMTTTPTPAPLPDDELERLLGGLRHGDGQALRRLATDTYLELRRLARNQLARNQVLTLGTTGLVNEWYLRMGESHGVDVADRGHFFVLAARIMRQVLCAHARERSAQKRGGGEAVLPIDEVEESRLHQARQFVELDIALERLARTEPPLARVVELRFFAGLTEPETAQAMDLPLRTVQRLWAQARQRLIDEVDESL